MIKNQLIFAKRSLYHLKREYGRKIDLYHIISETPDLETGKVIINRIKYKIRKGILLPTTLSREINLSGAFRRTNTTLESGETDVYTRFIVIDKEDLPTDFELTESDYLIIDGKRYQFQRIQELEDNIAVLITARYMKGSIRNEIFDGNQTAVKDAINLIDQFDYGEGYDHDFVDNLELVEIFDYELIQAIETGTPIGLLLTLTR